jgi:hypothetical protein
MKFKYYCKITDYVQEVNPDLAEILRGTCSNLTNLKGKNGLTFLMPTDKATIDELRKLAESDNIKDFTSACDMINAMIVYDVMNSPSDWADKKDDIPNALKQRIEVDSVSGKTVKFKSGATATLDEKFKPMVKDESRGPRLRVWALSGKIPVTTDKPTTFKYRLRKGEVPAAKKGGYSPSSSQLENLRWKIAIAVENLYMFDKEQSRVYGGAESRGYSDAATAPHSQHKSAFLDYALSLVDFIGRNHVDMLYKRVLPVVSFNNVDFYLLVEPHKTSGSYLLSDNVIESWWATVANNVFDTSGIIARVGQWLENPPAEFSKYAIYSNRIALINEVEEVRVNMSTSNPKLIAGRIRDVYANLVNNNTIGSIGNVLPDELIAYYRAEPGLKLVQDEMRYVTYLMFEQMEGLLSFTRTAYADIITYIADYMYGDGTDRHRMLKILNSNTLEMSIAPAERVNEINIFVNSTNFLYFPLSPSDIVNFPLKSVITKPDPFNIKYFNTAKATQLKHNRLIAFENEREDQQLVSLLNNVLSKSKSVSPDVRAMLDKLGSR